MKKFTLLILGLVWFGFLGAQNVVFHENFEQPSGADSVVAYSSSATNSWSLSNSLFSGGLQSDSAKCSPGDTLTLTTNAFATTGNNYVLLEFDHIAKIEALDKAVIHVSTDNGQTWNKLDTNHYMGNSTNFGSGGNVFNATSYGGTWNSGQVMTPTNSWWKHETFNISQFAADQSNVLVRFSLIDVNNTTIFENYGWFLDNIEVTISPSELIPPVISLIPPIKQDTIASSSPQTVLATVTDGSGVDTAYLVYYVNGLLEDTLGMTNFSADSFSVDIPFVGFGRTVTWFVEAVDNSAAANMAQSNNYSYFLKYQPQTTIEIGTGTNSASYPFYTFYHDSRTQILITASELQAQGAGSGVIDQIGFDVISAASQVMNGFNIEVKHTNLTTLDNLSAFVNSGWTNVYSGTYTVPGTGWQNIDFQNSFSWNGTSNILINICFDNTSYTSNTTVNSTAAAGMTYHDYTDGGAGCSLSSGSIQSDRPNVSLRIQTPSTLNNDAGVAQLVYPTGGVIANANFDVKTKIKNFGVDTISSVDIMWQLDGVNQTTYNYAGTLEPDSLSAELNLGTINVSQGSHNLTLWTDNPNGTFDDNTSNDTLEMSFYGCSSLLSGTYTIGGSGADFVDFNEALLSLTQCGISSPVTFNVNAGTYIEQLYIPSISGSSSSNTVTFQSASGDSTDVVIQYNASGTSDNYLIHLDGASNISFKSMTLEAQDSAFSRAVVLENHSESISFESNQFLSLDLSDDSDERAFIFVEDTLGDNFTFEHNYLLNGAAGLLLSGDNMLNVSIQNNVFDNQYAAAVQVANSYSPVVSYNSVQTGGMYDNFVGLGLSEVSGPFELAYNSIFATATTLGYGIFVQESFGDSLNKAQVYNNMISINGNAGGTNLSAGIVNLESRFIDYDYNTVRMTGNDQNTASMAIVDNTSGLSRGINIRNNIFSNFASGYAVFTQNLDSANVHNDFNNLFTDGNGDYISLNGNVINNLSEWQAASGEAANSVNIDPYYASANDLHTTNNLLNATATPIAGITDDIDGDSRDSSTPDIGADEFNPSPYDLTAVKVLAPSGGCGLSAAEDVIIQYKNIGSASVNSFSANYQITGENAVSETVNMTLNPGDTINYTFTAKADLDIFSTSKDSTFEFKAWVDYSADPVAQNDSLFFDVVSGYKPADPVPQPWTANYGDSITITAQSNDTLYWFANDSTANELEVGKFYTTPILYDTTTYWVEARAGSSDLKITEVTQYQGSGSGATSPAPSWLVGDDFVEITNLGSADADLSGYVYNREGTGAFTYNMPAITLAPGEVLVLATYGGSADDPANNFYVAASNSTSSNSATGHWLVDDQGSIVDAVALNGHSFTATSGVSSSDWSGSISSSSGNAGVVRVISDNNLAGDWDISSVTQQTLGAVNPSLLAGGNVSFSSGCASNRVPVTVNVTGIPTDNAGVSAVSTNSGCNLGMEPVTIDIYNNASVAINGNLSAAYRIDNNPFITPENVNISIQPNDTVSYTFNTLADLSAPVNDTTYSITAYVDLVNDTVNSNDTMMLATVSSLYTPPAIVVNDTTVGYGSPVTKTINSSSTVFWYVNDSTQFDLFKGSTFTTPVLYDTTTYYLENVVFSQMSYTIGTGTTSQNYAPAYGFYDYSWANMLYLSSEIGSDGVIDTIKFQLDGSVSNYNMLDQRIYMTNTSSSALTSTKPDPSTMTQVYQGSVNWNGSGWFEIVLNTPFEYDDQQNLQIYWENRDGSYTSGYPSFLSTSVSNLCYRNYADNTFPTGNGTSEDRPNIQLAGESKGCSSARVPWTINVLGQPDNDAAVVTMPYPNSGTELLSSEFVTIGIWNSGGQAISNFDVNYQIDNGSVVTENVSSTINSGDTLEYTFNQLADLSNYVTYNIKAWSSLSGDTIYANDTTYKQVTNSPLQYCASSASSTFDSEIDEVILNTLSNNTAGICADYSDFTSMSTTLMAGGTYTMSVTLGTCGGNYTKNAVVFFDWNRDGDFDDAGETGPTFGPAPATQTFIDTIQVPLNAATGNVRMRVVGVETTTPSSIQPCGTYNYGETEDYTVVVIPPIPQDAGITNILSPAFNGSEGQTDTLEVTLKNFGTDTIFSVDVNYEINGGTPVSFTFNDTLLPYNDTNILLPPFSRPADTSTVCVYTVLNGDSNIINDQTCYDIYGLPLADAKVLKVHPLASGCNLTTDTVIIDIYNPGVDTLITGFPVRYMRNNQLSAAVTETVNTDIAPGDTITYAFSTLVDLSVATVDSTYLITAWVDYSSDNNPNNDTAKVSTISKHTAVTPALVDPDITFGNNTTLNYASGDSLFWFKNDTTQNYFHIGNTYTTPILYDTTTYYVELTPFSPFSSQVGTGTSTTNYIPAYGFYDYGWSNMLYLSSEVGNAGMIDTVYFYVDNSISGYVMPNQTLFMENVGATALTTGKPDPANLTQVFDGPVDWNGPGWVAIPLDNAFFYDGQSNLQLYWENRDGDYSSPYPIFRATSVSGDYAVYEYQDNSFPVSAGSMSSVRPNIKFAGNDVGCASNRVPWNVNVIGHPPIDGQLLEVVEPVSGMLKSNSEPVTYSVKNNGTDSLLNVKVGYIFDGQTAVEENLSVTMGPGDTLLHTFNTTVDMSDFKSYPLTAYVHVVNDTVTVNDTIQKSVSNLLDYCISTATNAYDDTYIENVQLNGLDNTSTNSDADYTDFTGSVQPPIIYPGMTHNMSVSMDAGYFNTSVVKVFIDVNRDGVLDETSETFFTETINSSSNKIAIGTLALPSTALPGQTLMRVVLQETSNPADVHPCGTYSYGETEDYLVHITPLIPQDAGVIAINKPEKFVINANQQFEVDVKNYGQDTIYGLDIHYTYGSVNNTYTANNVIAPADTATISMPSLSMPYGNVNLCVTSVLLNDSNSFNDGLCKQVYREYVTAPPYVDDFETNNYFRLDTSASALSYAQWEFGQPMGNTITGAHSGQTAWMIDLDSNYANSQSDMLYTPKFAIATTGVDSLIFWHYYDTEQGGDGGYVQYMNTSGNFSMLGAINDPSAVNWYTDNVGGPDGFSGNSGGWVRSAICIDSAHIPDMASITQFRFVFTSDGSTNTGDGWAIDDVEIKIPRSPYDAGINQIITPGDSTIVGAGVTVSVEVRNFGINNLTSFPVTYQIGNNPPETQTW
ncbi:MAG: GEVED domain-containing protein, partial [Bacteroidota bacterium]